MYELSRVRLYSVGPAGARYQDVRLDLSDAGRPVQHAQEPLFGAGVRRPSPATILFLENGGGKSVLIKLIFSVMLPGRRQVVGTSSTRVLEKFVGAGDVAHVVLEWMHTETGGRLITGKMSDWGGRAAGTDGNELNENWYCFRPGDALNLDTLPFAVGEDRVSATAYRRTLNDIDDEDNSIDLFWTDRHGRWSEQLGSLGLDTELFRYQRAMNAGEGEAADAFTFTSDEAFVEFLLRAVLPAGEAEDLAETIAGLAETLSQREALQLEHDFVEVMLDVLDPLVAQTGQTETARANARAAAVALDHFVARVAGRVSHEQTQLGQHQTRLGELTTAGVTAEDDLRLARGRHAALEVLVARLRLRDAQEAKKQATTARDQARLVVDGWTVVKPLADLKVAEAEAAQLGRVVAEQSNIAQAAESARDARSRDLARALLAMKVEALAAAGRESTTAESVKKEVTREEEAWQAAMADAATAKAAVGRFDGQVAEVESAIADAVQNGLIASATSIAGDLAELDERVRDGTAVLGERERQLTDLDQAHDEALQEFTEAQQKHSTALRRAEDAKKALDTAMGRTAELAAEPRLLELIDVETVMLESDADALTERLLLALHDTDEKRKSLQVAESADERARLALTAAPDALLPPPVEVVEVQELLEANEIRCYAGWSYLADKPEAVRSELVRRLPQLAGGVLLNDLKQLADARRVLAEAGIAPSPIITVASIHSLGVAVDAKYQLAHAPDDDLSFVVPPNPALYQHDAARAEADRIEERHRQRTDELARLDSLYRSDSDLSARLGVWREEFPPGTLAGLAETVALATDAAAATATTLAGRQKALQEAKESRNRLREEIPPRRTALQALVTRTELVRALADREQKAAGWRQEAEKSRGKESTANALAARLRGSADELIRRQLHHERKAGDSQALAARISTQITEIEGDTTVTPDSPIPAEPVAVLTSLLRSAQLDYERAKVGIDLIAQRDRAQTKADALRSAFDVNPAATRAEAENLLASPAGVDEESRQAAASLAREALDTAENLLGGAVETATLCADHLKKLPGPEIEVELAEQPTDTDHGADLLRATEHDRDVALAHQEAVAKELAATRGAADRAQQAVEAFEMIVTSHRMTDEVEPEHSDEQPEPYQGDAESARAQYAEAYRTRREARAEAQRAERVLRRLTEGVVDRAKETRFESLHIPLRTRIVEMKELLLAEQASDLQAQLRPRLRSLADDLEQVDRHRTMIVNRLKALVENGLRVLRLAQKLSRLPAELRGWQDREFLQIGFTQLTGELLSHQLGQVVDDVAGGQSANPKKDGLSIVLSRPRAGRVPPVCAPVGGPVPGRGRGGPGRPVQPAAPHAVTHTGRGRGPGRGRTGPLRCGPARISAATGVPARTVSRVLARRGVAHLAECDPLTGQRIRATRHTTCRYEHPAPGDLVHLDVKKIGKIPPGGGWKAHGRGPRPNTVRGLGYDYVHAAVDNHSRLAYAEILADEKGTTCADSCCARPRGSPATASPGFTVS